MVMNIHIYGTFEKESQWRGASDRSGHIYITYTYDTDDRRSGAPGTLSRRVVRHTLFKTKSYNLRETGPSKRVGTAQA